MQLQYSQIYSDILAETDPFMERLDRLPGDTAAELYNILDKAAQSASEYIHLIDPELRFRICARLDMILDRVIDVTPSFIAGEQVGIYTPGTDGFRRWKNVELLKDKGLTGYMLAKEIGAKHTMLFGTKPGDYPYINLLPDQEMLFSMSDNMPDEYSIHLQEKHYDMDVIIFHGMYFAAMKYLKAYRAVRPDGKTYCGLDMNGAWMRTTPWESPPVRKFADQCDVIATSCTPLRDALNRNPLVNFPCRWLPNGFLNITGAPVKAEPAYKENVILTVGRIGSGQKNTEELLFGFAMASEMLKGWSLRVVGTVEPDFKPYIEKYFSVYPNVKGRVVFTGPIENKAALYDEYAKAKIFILTSKFEGGTPNVYAESLFHGCKFITSGIDAADDITNFGELGVKYTTGDLYGLKNALIETCRRMENTGEVTRHIRMALAYANKNYDWRRNVKKLAYMLFHN